MSKIIDRISEIIEDKRLSNRAFEMSIGASNGMIGRAVSKGTDITAEWLSKIIDAYPDINSEWLLTGNGDRYRTKPLPIASDVRSPYMTGDIRRADNSCDRQRFLRRGSKAVCPMS